MEHVCWLKDHNDCDSFEKSNPLNSKYTGGAQVAVKGREPFSDLKQSKLS